MQKINFRVRQRPILGPVRYFIGQAFLPFGNRGAQVLVEYLNLLDQSFAEILDPVDDLLGGKSRPHIAPPVLQRKTWKSLECYCRGAYSSSIEVKFEKQQTGGTQG